MSFNVPRFAIYQCIQCVFNVLSFYIQCSFNVLLYIHCLHLDVMSSIVYLMTRIQSPETSLSGIRSGQDQVALESNREFMNLLQISTQCAPM